MDSMNNVMNVLDPNRLNDLEYLKNTADEFDVNDCDLDFDAVYRYAQLLYSGADGVEEDKERAVELLAYLFINLSQMGGLYDDGLITEEYKDIFLGAEYFTSNEFGPNDYLIDIASIIQRGIPGVLDADPERAFKLVDSMPPMYGMVGGMELVENVRIKDFAELFLANCYMYGIGVKQNLWSALSGYLRYHTDHLAQKWHDSLITDEFDRLYPMIESVDDSTLDKHGLFSKYCSLTVMTMEGIGCVPNPVKAMQYLIRARECNESIYKDNPFGFEDLNGWFWFDFKYFCRLLSFNARPFEKDMWLRPGQHVYLGKYNNRAVSWKVLDVSDDKALLLADEVLESSALIGSRCMNGDWKNAMINYIVDIDSDMDSYLYDSEKGTGTCFLLTADMVEEYLPAPEDRICYYRQQAYSNTTRGDSDYNQLASWWLLSEDDKGNDVQQVVNIDGEIYESNYHRDFGIRPAMYVKIRK